MTTTTPINPQVQAVIDELGDQLHEPTTVNRFGGIDVRLADASTLRLATEDPETGLEVYRLTPNGVLLWQARFDTHDDATLPLVAEFVRGAARQVRA